MSGYILYFLLDKKAFYTFFIDKNDKFYHYQNYSFNYDLGDDEWDLLNEFGVENIIKTVKEMAIYETRKLSNIVKLVRFE